MNVDELIELLRALARHEHSDVSIAEEAADALEAAQIKGGMESRAFTLGHFREVLNSAPTQQADKVQCHYEYIVVDPTEESDAGIWPVLVPDGFTIVPAIEVDDQLTRGG